MPDQFDHTDSTVGKPQLRVNGRLFGGWKTVHAGTGMEQCAGAFSLGVMDRWAVQAERWAIQEGDACELLLDDQVVITGYVDVVMPSLDRGAHTIQVAGRDKTMDLVDCSAIHKGGQWKKVAVDRIARDLAAPFDIDVVAVGDMGDKFDSFHIEEGEKAFETIERAARMRGLLVTTDGTGRLILTRATNDKAVDAIVEGENLYSGRSEISWKERYSDIIVKGQAKGDAETFGAAVAHGRGEAKDSSIGRYRPLIIISEHHGKGASFKQRAEWERNVRRGRGSRATVRVQGWRAPSGAIWRSNRIVSVQAPTLCIEEDLLIARCSYLLDEHGTFTELELVHRAAFDTLEGVGRTRLNRRITGADGLEDSRGRARRRAKGTGAGEIIQFENGKPR